MHEIHTALRLSADSCMLLMRYSTLPTPTGTWPRSSRRASGGRVRPGLDPTFRGTDVLTVEMMNHLIDQVEREHEPPERELILPSWFPDDQIEFADEWARQHGWTGVRRG